MIDNLRQRFNPLLKFCPMTLAIRSESARSCFRVRDRNHYYRCFRFFKEKITTVITTQTFFCGKASKTNLKQQNKAMTNLWESLGKPRYGPGMNWG